MIDPRAERRDAAAYATSTANHLIRLATELEEIAFRKMYPDREFNRLVVIFTPSPDGTEIRAEAIACSLPAGVELRLPTDPMMIEWIAQDRHTIVQISDGQFELVGLQPGVTADMVRAAWK